MKPIYYKSLLSLIITFLLISTPVLVEAQKIQKYRVVDVHDGDTVSIRTSSFIGIPFKTERVRLIGMDAPELKQEPWGRNAKRHLKKLLSENDWVVSVELDVDQRDQYNRLLAYLWGKGGVLINERMIADGFAVLYTLPPNVKYADRFREAQRQAQRLKKGIWGRSGISMSPEQWRRTHPR